MSTGLLRVSCLLYHKASKIPLILVSKCTLRSQNASGGNAKKTLPSVSEIEKQFSSLQVPVELPNQKSLDEKALQDMKRKGFSGIVDWCLLHQQDKLAGDAELSTADDKVVSWLLSSVSLFTCGQCLVLLGMLCEVFVRRAATDNEFLLEGVENGILRVIAALSQRVENSDNLDKQPLRIVVGAVYGLQRVEQCLMPSARSAMPPSPGLYYTLASVSQQCESAEAGVLLTLLLVLSENAFMDLITEKERVKTTEKTAQMLTELLEKDAEKKGDETLTRQIPLSEVISIMENIRSTDVRQRLAIFKYLAFTVKRHYDSAEQQLIKSAVDTLSGIPDEERLPLTSQFVQQYSITSIPVALSLLPYVTDETAFLERGEFLSVKSIASMTAFDASFVLLIVGNRIGIEKLRLLVSTALGGYEPLLKRYTACLSASVAVDGEEGDALSYMEEAEDEEELVKLEEGGASEKKIPMDQTLYNVLHFLMVNAPEGFLDAKGKKTLIAAIVNQINWLEMSEETATQLNSSFDVQVTKMLVRVMKQKLLVEELDSATFYEKRIKPLLGQPRMDLTTSPEFVDLLRDCIQQMDSTELRRAILERALYFNGTDTVDSICKFLDSLSDLCVKLRFYPRLVLKVLLVTKHIDARATTWVSDDESSAVTHKLLCNGLRYMLSVPEWQIDDQRDDIRTACSNWVEHYFQVLQLQRRQSTEGKEDDRQEVLSNDEMERLLALALQVGCKFTNFTFSEVNRRVHAGLGSRQAAEGGSSEESSDLQRDALPHAAHFILLVRGDFPISFPLGLDYFSSLLEETNVANLSALLTAYLTAVKKVRSGADLEQDLTAAQRFFTVLHQRARDLPEESDNVSLSGLNATMFFIGYLSRIDAYDAIFGAMPAANNKAATVSTGEEDSEEAPFEADASSFDAVHHYTSLIASVEELLSFTFTHLNKKHVKELALAHLGKLSFCFPKAAEFLFSRLKNQLKDFTHAELFTLAVRYPESEADVMACLQTTDLQTSVEITQFLRQAKRLPMNINVALIQAHFSRLNFSLATRLLSALASRHEEVPFSILSQLLRLVTDKVESATDSDRNLLLLVLQRYLVFNGDEEGMKQKKMEEASMDSAEESAKSVFAKTAAPVVLPPEEIQSRRKLVNDCCDKVLKIDSIQTLEDLQTFFHSYPSSLQSMTRLSIVKHAESHILTALLQAEPPSVTPVLAYTKLMAEHDMLSYASVRKIYKLLFVRCLKNREEEAKPPFSPSECVQLSLLLAKAKNNQVKAREKSYKSLAKVLHFFQSKTDRLAMLAEFAETHSDNNSRTALTPYDALLSQLCLSLLTDGSQFIAAEWANYLRYVSKMRKWNVLLRDEQTTTCFDRNFRDFFRGADPHSRCVILKALTTEGGLLEKYETFVVEYIQQDIPLLSPEDIESILNVVLKMKRREEIESVMDIVGTRLLPLLPQCKRSTLIRTLQCCGAFQINDSELIQRVLATLEDQCVGQHSHGVNLNAAQLFTLLNAIEKLNISSEKSAEQLVIFSFMSIRRQLGVLSIQQVAEAARLAVSLEMGFTVYISDIVSKLLEFRDTNKNPQVAEAVVAVCSVYRVEAPQPMVINKLRKQKNKDRAEAYWASFRQFKVADS